MKIISKNQMVELLNTYPDEGVLFSEYVHGAPAFDLMVADEPVGARYVVPGHGVSFKQSWKIEEYQEHTLFAIFDNKDILQIIQTLVCRVSL